MLNPQGLNSSSLGAGNSQYVSESYVECLVYSVNSLPGELIDKDKLYATLQCASNRIIDSYLCKQGVSELSSEVFSTLIQKFINGIKAQVSSSVCFLLKCVV
jgi:hypothetical protein